MIITTVRKGRLSIEPGCRTTWLSDAEYHRLLKLDWQEACEAQTPSGVVCIEVNGKLQAVKRKPPIVGTVPARRVSALKHAAKHAAFGLALGIAIVAVVRSCTWIP